VPLIFLAMVAPLSESVTTEFFVENMRLWLQYADVVSAVGFCDNAMLIFVVCTDGESVVCNVPGAADDGVVLWYCC